MEDRALERARCVIENILLDLSGEDALDLWSLTPGAMDDGDEFLRILVYDGEPRSLDYDMQMNLRRRLRSALAREGFGAFPVLSFGSRSDMLG